MKHFLLLLILLSCSTSKKDPLIYSKKLISEGHKSLYHNGAFQIPYSTVKFIPAAPSTIGLVTEMSGLKARESFMLSVEKAKESFVIIKKGSLKSHEMSKTAADQWLKIADYIGTNSKKNSLWLIDRSQATGIGMIKTGYQLSIKKSKQMIEYADELPAKSLLASQNFSEKFQTKPLKPAIKDFIIGYIALPDKIADASKVIDNQKSFEEFKKNNQSSNEFRKEMSKGSWYFIKDAVMNYASNISDSLIKADNELGNIDEYGISISLFKALGWVVEATIWQGLIAPLGKMTIGGIGYVVTNGIVYPVMMVSTNSVTTLKVAIEYSQFAGESVYHIFAPSTKLAVASVLTAGNKIIDVVGTNSIKASGQVAKVVTKYVGVPVVFVGTNLLMSSTGSIVSAAGTTMGATNRAVGESIKLTAPVLSGSLVLAGTVTGTTSSVVYGTSVVLYHSAQSMVVPPSLVLGSGLILTYGTLTHLSAQTILALGDVSYVVLSLEGPRWVLYGITGKVDKNDYEQGTVIDLNELQKKGEEIKVVPLSDEEVEKLF